MKKPITIRVDPKLLKQAKEQAVKERRTLTSLIEYAVEKYLNNKP